MRSGCPWLERSARIGASPCPQNRRRRPTGPRRPRPRGPRDGRGAGTRSSRKRLASTPDIPALRPDPALGVAQDEVRPGPRDPDVQEPSLLVERGRIADGLVDRQRALLEHRQEDDIPFEALGPVVREEVDADVRARPLVLGPGRELGEVPLGVEVGLDPRQPMEDLEQGLEAGLPLACLVAAGRCPPARCPRPRRPTPSPMPRSDASSGS